MCVCVRTHARERSGEGGRETERGREGERNYDKWTFMTMEADKVPGQSPWSPRKAEDKGSRSGQQVQSQDESAVSQFESEDRKRATMSLLEGS